MNDKTMQIPLNGGCLCGAVRYKITQFPKRMGLCHCRSCQQATGSAYYPFMAVLEESVSITGEFKEYASIGFSGQPVHRSFCPHCGSMLFGRHEARPDFRIVSAASLDNPSEYRPEMHVWLEDAQSWTHMNPELKKFDRNPF